MGRTILIVEDDPGNVAVLREVANELGCTLDHAEDGETGLEMALRNDYDLLVLDLTLPRLGGLEVCRRVRERDRTVAILILTSRSEDIDKVLGLEIGADDYLTKPFNLKELLARIKALLRRVEVLRESPYVADEGPCRLEFGGLIIDVLKREVTRDGKLVSLTAIEFELLVYLASRPGWVIPRETITEDVLGHDLRPRETNLSTLIHRLRGKIEQDRANPRYIRSVRGVGYCFMDLQEVEGE